MPVPDPLRWMRRLAYFVVAASLFLMFAENAYQAAMADVELQLALAQEEKEAAGEAGKSGTEKTGKKVQAPAKKFEGPIAYRGARIHTVSGPVIDNGVLVVHKGKIVAVGPADRTELPPDTKVRDVKGMVIIPGLVDTHSHIGIFQRPGVPAHSDGNETTGPVQPGLRALDAINPDDPGIKMALAGGVTTANIMPGSANAIGGQTLYVKLRGTLIHMMRILTGRRLGGIKFANGENPKGAYGSKGMAPGTRMKVAALQRETLLKAQQYKKTWDTYNLAKKEGKEAKAPDRDLSLEPLLEVLEKRRTVHFHCHRADDIMTAVRLSQEFNFELVLQHCTEGYRVANELARLGIWCSLTIIDSPGGKPETMGLLEENAAILTKAGVKVSINTDDPVTESRFLLRSGAIAVRGGMSEDEALKTITLHPAQMLHLDESIGSLEKGKDADFVILSGAPFSVYTQVLETYIEGEKVFDRSVNRDWSYQAGGFAASDATRLPGRAELLKPIAPARVPMLPKDAPRWKEGDRKVAILAGRIHTISKGTIEDGVILVEDGKIQAVGPRGKIGVPAGMPVLAAAEVTPGLIDSHTVVGLSGPLNYKKADQDQDELSDPNQADLRVLDSFYQDDSLLQFIREQGVTVIHAVPGRANVIAGQTGVFRTFGPTADKMALRFPAGLLVNLGEVPKSSYSGKINTRMGTANLLRTQLSAAQAYSKKKEASKDTPTNLKHEALELALRKKIPVHIAAHRADDLATGLRIAEEFGLDPVLHFATEGYFIGDTLARAKVPVVLHPAMQRNTSMETFHTQLGNAAALSKKGLLITHGTGFEGYVPKTRILRSEVAIAMANGLGHEKALRSITLDAAKLLRIDDRFGSIEVGKEADLVLYDGDPFEHVTHVTHTIGAGQIIYDRAEVMKLPFARRALPLAGGDFGCCLGAW